jgi:pimeloyl-ACP methyl ester carboxylesterase
MTLYLEPSACTNVAILEEVPNILEEVNDLNMIPTKISRTTSGTMEFAQLGEGEPTVLLINGGSGPIDGWYKVIHEIAKTTTVVAYNRFGVGNSDKPSTPQHGNAVVTALRQLLQEENIKPPFLLVGHSLGGFYANLFARQFPNEAAGVVLLESSHPLDLKINETQNAFLRTVNRLFALFDSFFPHRKWGEVHYVEETIKQIEQADAFPDVPLIVVSGGKKPPMMPDHVFEMRRNNQLDFVQLNKQGKHVLAACSGHFPQLSEPEIVIQAILDCLHLARKGSLRCSPKIPL